MSASKFSFFIDHNHTATLYFEEYNSCHLIIQNSSGVAEEIIFFPTTEQAFEYLKANEKELNVPQNLTEDIPF